MSNLTNKTMNVSEFIIVTTKKVLSDKPQNSNDFIANVSSGHHEMPDVYQVYLSGKWIADCYSYEEAETIANREAMNGQVDIERI